MKLRRTRWAFISAALILVVLIFVMFSQGGLNNAVEVRKSPLHQDNSAVTFEIINHAKEPVAYRIAVEKRSHSGWPSYPPGTLLPYTGPDEFLPPRGKTNVSVFPAPAQAWRLSVCYHRKLGKIDKFKETVAMLLDDSGCTTLANKIPQSIKAHIVLGPEIPFEARQ